MDILIVDDEKSIRETTSIAVEAEGHYAEGADSGRITELKLGESEFDMMFLDLRLGDEDGLEVLQKVKKMKPKMPVVMFTAYASVGTAVKAAQLGAFDYIEKPFSPDQLRGVLIKAEKEIRNQGKIEELEVKVEELHTEVSKGSPEPRFESDDPQMAEAYSTLFRAADTNASVLILGESGTGKSLVARQVHAKSHLSKKPFITISCPSLSKELLESELFGHVKGSFTGAVKDKFGKVHAANGGTLFLDEIGELPMEIQPKLLRLLQEREYERLGENKTRQAEVRVIAATNRDLSEDVAAGTFREDLFYRLNVIAVELPPLRARPLDLTRFAEDYLKFFASQVGRKVSGFTKPALAHIKEHPWPGNLRELRNAIERAVILARGAEVDAGDLPDIVVGGITAGGGTAGGENSSGLTVGGDVTVEELENAHIKLVLAKSKSIQGAATILGIDQATLYRKRRKLGLLD